MFWGFLEKIIKMLGGISSFLSIFAFWRKKKVSSSDTNQSIHVEQKETTTIKENVSFQNSASYAQSENCGNQYVNSPQYINSTIYVNSNPSNVPENEKIKTPDKESVINNWEKFICFAGLCFCVSQQIVLGVMAALLVSLFAIMFHFRAGQLKYPINPKSMPALNFALSIVSPFLPLFIFVSYFLSKGESDPILFRCSEAAGLIVHVIVSFFFIFNTCKFEKGEDTFRPVYCLVLLLVSAFLLSGALGWSWLLIMQR